MAHATDDSIVVKNNPNPERAKIEPYLLAVNGKNFTKQRFLDFISSDKLWPAEKTLVEKVTGLDFKTLLETVKNLSTSHVSIGYNDMEALAKLANTIKRVEIEEAEAKEKLQWESVSRSTLNKDIKTQKEAITALASYLPTNCCEDKSNCYRKLKLSGNKKDIEKINFYNVSFDDNTNVTVFPVGITTPQDDGSSELTLINSSFGADVDLHTQQIIPSKKSEDAGILQWKHEGASEHKFKVKKLPVIQMLSKSEKLSLDQPTSMDQGFPPSFTTAPVNSPTSQEKKSTSGEDFACYLVKIGKALGVVPSKVRSRVSH